MMLSESQERMLMVLKPGQEEEAEAIFEKWGLDFAIVGKTTDTCASVVKHQGEVVANLPIKDLGDEAPEYDRPWIEPASCRRCSPPGRPAADAGRGAAQARRLARPAQAAGSGSSTTR
jgi:phosphoribosylformylglycinamidine (FGAM) synthase-like enzyme